MTGKKDILAKWMLHTGCFKPLRFHTRNNCTAVSYHRIKATDAHKTAFDDSGFAQNQDEFIKQVQWLKENNDVLSEGELLSIVRGEYSPPRRSALITFDDGYIDNYTLAYPVLKSFNVPAIFFVPTRAIEERHLGWWDHISFLIKAAKKDKISFLGKSFSKRHSFDNLVHYILSLIYQNKQSEEEILTELVKSCEVDLPDSDIQSAELMTWDQLREMSQKNIAIGSHTHSHTILSSLDSDAQKTEFELSKQIIEKKLGVGVRSISYPCGNYHNFSDTSRRLVAETGYDLAFSFLTGINTYGAIDPTDVRRIQASNFFPRFVATFELPALFCDNHDSIVAASGLYERVNVLQ